MGRHAKKTQNIYLKNNFHPGLGKILKTALATMSERSTCNTARALQGVSILSLIFTIKKKSIATYWPIIQRNINL